MSRKVPRRIWKGIGTSGQLTQGHLTRLSDVKYYSDKGQQKFVEYILAGSETRAVCRRLERWIIKNYPVITDDGEWTIINDIRQELKRIGGNR